MWRMIRRIKEAADLTVFLTTHYIEEADELCDRVAIFDHGRIVALDRPDVLKRGLAHTESIDVEFAATPLDWPATLEALPGVVQVRRANGGYRLESRDRLATVAALVDAVRTCGVDLGSLVARGETLEDVVIRYTGRDLRDAADHTRRLEIRHLYERGRGRG
jgi:ABC-2 type transport system ATP-binding protein